MDIAHKVTNSFRENPNIYRLYDLENSSCTERNLIVHLTESERTADGIRSDGGRNPIGRRTESDQAADGICQKRGTLIEEEVGQKT